MKKDTISLNDLRGYKREPVPVELTDAERKAYVDYQMAMLNNQSPLYAQHMMATNDALSTGTAGQAASIWQFTVEKPRARILDKDFEYVHSSKTDVQATWRKFGWVPLGEQREQQSS